MTPPAPSQSRSAEPSWTKSDLEQNPHEAADKGERVRQMFASIAHVYDLNNRLHSFGRDQAWRRAAVRLAEPKPGDRVLDVACGTGDLARAFARAGPARVVGIDFTREMLEIARRKDHAQPTVEYVEGDAMSLPFEDGSFDIVSIAFGIRNVRDPALALAEFARVLAPSGRVVVLEFGRPDNRLLRRLNDAYCRVVMPRTASLIGRDRSGAYRYLPRSIETFLSPEAMTEALETAGFERIVTRSMTFGVCRAFRGDLAT